MLLCLLQILCFAKFVDSVNNAAVCCQNFHLLNNKRRVAAAMILYSSAVALMLSLPPILGWGHFAPEENGMRWGILYVDITRYEIIFKVSVLQK